MLSRAASVLFVFQTLLAWHLRTPLVRGQQVAAPAHEHHADDMGPHPMLGGGEHHEEASHQVHLLMRLRAAEWQFRTQHVEALLEEYKGRHEACTSGEAMPGPYILMRMEDDASGLGNELPAVVTGTFACFPT